MGRSAVSELAEDGCEAGDDSWSGQRDGYNGKEKKGKEQQQRKPPLVRGT